ncbi:MAG: STAS domain-containing protein [Gammaproteobacteria bacterium]|nr:STAS domain-containing protein [Gammaproteobacteria bacterium]
MSRVNLQQASPGQWALSGELNMQTVPELFASSQSLFAGLQGKISIDLQQVTRSDSAGLALLIAWMRMAQARSFEVCYQHLPKQMLQIAQVSELDKILPLG